MKIAIYKDTFSNNRGADVAVKNLASGLSERGHAVTLFDKTRFDSEIRGDYDVIVSTGTNEILDLAKAGPLPPVVQQFHTDPRYPFRHWFKRWRRNKAIKAALRKASAFQVLSERHVDVLRDILGPACEGKVSVIGNWSAYERREMRDFRERRIILCPGAVNKDKNQSLLVDAFAEVADEFPDWEVHVYGNGKRRDELALRGRIAAKGLSGRVHLKGYADLAGPYSECAFVAFPSRTEGFGMVVLDAAWFSKPSLLIEDWIGCGETVRPSDYAAGLRRLMADSEYRHALGRRANAVCSERYTRAKLLDQWESLLRANWSLPIF